MADDKEQKPKPFVATVAMTPDTAPPRESASDAKYQATVAMAPGSDVEDEVRTARAQAAQLVAAEASLKAGRPRTAPPPAPKSSAGVWVGLVLVIGIGVAIAVWIMHRRG